MSHKNVKFPEIKKTLCERERVSRTELRKAIRESSGEDRYDAWCDKRSHGYYTRHALLVYAMVRGLPYCACEKKCEIPPSVYTMRETAKEHGLLLNEAVVKAWLASEPVDKATLYERVEVPTAQESDSQDKGVVAGIKRLFGIAS